MKLWIEAKEGKVFVGDFANLIYLNIFIRAFRQVNPDVFFKVEEGDENVAV